MIVAGIKIERGNISTEFGVTKLPNRKSQVLYAMRGNMLEPLAYFRNDESAERFDKIIAFIIEASSGREEECDRKWKAKVGEWVERISKATVSEFMLSDLKSIQIDMCEAFWGEKIDKENT